MEQELEFDVNMNTGVLYDYSLFHTYTGPTGIIGTVVGFLLIMNFIRYGNILYLIFGIVTVLYLPVAIYMNCKRQMTLVEAYKNPLHYKLSSEGICVSQGDIVQNREWSCVTKAVSTGKSLILYTGKNIAIIFPRADLSGDVTEAIKIICRYVDPKKVKIRY